MDLLQELTVQKLLLFKILSTKSAVKNGIIEANQTENLRIETPELLQKKFR